MRKCGFTAALSFEYFQLDKDIVRIQQHSLLWAPLAWFETHFWGWSLHLGKPVHRWASSATVFLGTKQIQPQNLLSFFLQKIYQDSKPKILQATVVVHHQSISRSQVDPRGSISCLLDGLVIERQHLGILPTAYAYRNPQVHHIHNFHKPESLGKKRTDLYLYLQIGPQKRTHVIHHFLDGPKS